MLDSATYLDAIHREAAAPASAAREGLEVLGDATLLDRYVELVPPD